MPRCHRCDRVQPTAEVRKTALGHVCKDKPACARRVRANQETMIDERSAAA
jgi:hypothetical protein